MSRAGRAGISFLRTCLREAGRDRCQQSSFLAAPCAAVVRPLAGASTARLTPCTYSSIAIFCCPKGYSTPEPASSLQAPQSHVPCGSRLYKIASTGLVDIPEQVVSTHQHRKSLEVMAMLESSNRLVVDLNQARMPEAWRRRRFYMKPKVKRNMHKWNGIIKRKRKDFNYRLRWALKSMSRYTRSK